VCVVSEEWDTTEIFSELVEDLGLHLVEDGQLDRADLVLLDAGGRRVLVELKRLSTPAPAQVSRLIAGAELRSRPDALHVLVADRIPEAVRAELRSHGWGWLDLRGHLRLVGHGVFVDVDVPQVKARAERSDAFSGSAGLEVACSLLLEPDIQHGVRDLARSLGRSPSTVSDVLAALRRQGLVGADSVAVLPELFWETASAWRPSEVPLMDLPRPGTGSVNAALQVGFDEIEAEPGWALTGTLAAATYGAPIAARSDHPPDFYVPSQATLRRAMRLLGVAVDPDSRRSSVRVAPVPAVCNQRVDPLGQQAKTWAFTNEPWPLAKPLFVALDLARDPGRGREILEGWQPPKPWRRVW
jgi:Bacterial regulatory protein, arsR family